MSVFDHDREEVFVDDHSWNDEVYRTDQILRRLKAVEREFDAVGEDFTLEQNEALAHQLTEIALEASLLWATVHHANAERRKRDA